MTDAEIIETHIAERGVTKCPTVFLVPIAQLAQDKITVVPMVRPGETKSQTLARLYSEGYSCMFLARMFEMNPTRVAQLVRNEGVTVERYSAKKARENWIARGGGW